MTAFFEDETKVCFNQDCLVREISEDTGISQKDIYTVLKSLEKSVSQAAAYVEERKQVNIKIFKGLILNYKYEDEKMTKNPQTNEQIKTLAKVKGTARLTRRFNENLDNLWKNR